MDAVTGKSTGTLIMDFIGVLPGAAMLKDLKEVPALAWALPKWLRNGLDMLNGLYDGMIVAEFMKRADSMYADFFGGPASLVGASGTFDSKGSG